MVETSIDVSNKNAKLGFAKEFLGLIPPGFTFQNLEYNFKVYAGITETDTLSFGYPDTVSVYSLWKNPVFIAMNKELQSMTIYRVNLRIRGWLDSVYSTQFEDPEGGERSLFKVQVGLVSGRNDIYFSGGSKSEALLFSTDFRPEAVPAADRSDDFHGSPTAEACAMCHSGLTDPDAAALPNEECVACHTGIKRGHYQHGPAEMDECGTCHVKNSETNVVEVPEGVPETCAPCHEEKVNTVETSAVPHPVAGECVMCHSPHSSERSSLLKSDIFTLCTGCHDNHALNHPVGRHPVRFATIQKTGEEISCVSCHNPHGSENPALLTVGGGRMMVCLQCHDK